MSSHVQARFVSADMFAGGAGWAPSCLIGPASVALKAGLRGYRIADLGGEVLEGWRVSETQGALNYDPRALKTPIYRQVNLGRLRLQLSETQWESPQISERFCVRPGDVVLNKLSPVRAAVVSYSARRHPADGNLLIVRGLPWAAATWLAVCLNRPEYEQLLLIDSGVLRRVGIRTLLELRFPPVPIELEAASPALRELLDEMILAGERLYRIKGEAAHASHAPSILRNLSEGTFFDCGSMSSISWLPTASALRADQSFFARELSWTSIRSLASAEDRRRLTVVPRTIRIVRLRDVTDDLLVEPASEDSKSDLAEGRILGSPLTPGEVLLSTVGTSFRVAYADEGVTPSTFPVDGWVRIRFRETPAAWALLLSTDAIRSQAARLAIGSAQQFVPPEALLSIHVPVPDRDTRERWQQAIERHHAQRRALQRRWDSLLQSLASVFERVHGICGTCAPRAQEVLQ